MAGGSDKFYNMQVYLIKNGKLYAEEVAIRNIWEKDNGAFFDIYVHRLKKSFVFDAVFIGSGAGLPQQFHDSIGSCFVPHVGLQWKNRYPFRGTYS